MMSPLKNISYQPYNRLPFEEIRALDEKYILNTYNRVPISFHYGSGEFLYDSHGKEYIDFLSGLAVTSMGHAHADALNALNHQAELLWHSSNLFYNQEQALLARALIEITFPGKVFFCNSGTEANEAALKLIKAWGKKESKPKIVALRNSFHGRSLGSISVTGQAKVREGFGDLIPDVTFIEPNDLDELASAVDARTAGLIVEPILGEGGVIPIGEEFMLKARELCGSHGAIFAMDEVQTGIGRTGTYFCYQQFDCKPDLLTTAKGLGGGFPIGAMLVSEKFTDVLSPGMHGSTFGGNHLASGVAYETLRIIESSGLLDHVKEVSAHLWRGLERLKKRHPDKIKEIRGKGLMIGILLREDIPARPLVEKLLEKYLVIGRAGENVIRLLPPLILRKTTADRGLERLAEVIGSIK